MHDRGPWNILRTLADSVSEFKRSLTESAEAGKGIPYGPIPCPSCAQRVHPIRDVQSHLVCPFCGHVLDDRRG